ncbi:hypothetical protein NKG05_03695 [Oerskovia sp. M15]
MLRFAVGFLMAAVIIAGIGALATHYLYGGLRIGPLAATARAPPRRRASSCP